MIGSREREEGERLITANRSIMKPKLLLGEGRDEDIFFGAMLEHLGKEDMQVLSYGGKSRLAEYLKALMNDPMWPQVEALLITRDADFPRERAVGPAAESAWWSVIDALRARGLPVPGAHAELTTQDAGSTEPALRVGVFILPDGASDGMLEDLCIAAVAEDPVKPCLDAYFRCIEEKGAGVPRNTLPKARAHAFLASRPIPDQRVGEAARKGYWPWDAPAFEPLLTFVKSAWAPPQGAQGSEGEADGAG